FSHSALMLATRITWPHFSVSSAIIFAKSSGAPPIGVPLNSAIRTLIFASSSTTFTSLLTREVIPVGTPLGATSPIHALASNTDDGNCITHEIVVQALIKRSVDGV